MKTIIKHGSTWFHHVITSSADRKFFKIWKKGNYYLKVTNISVKGIDTCVCYDVYKEKKGGDKK